MLIYKSLILASLLRAIAGSSILTSNPNGCVDANSFIGCINQANTFGASCIRGCQIGDVNCDGACGSVYVDNEIECYIQFCWNKVYSCEYQDIWVGSGLENVRGAFYPAPKDAPGGCNCNLHDVYQSEQTWLNNWVGCANLATGDAETYNSCQCCVLGGLAAAYNACPGIECSPLLSEINVPGDISTLISSNNFDISSCNAQVLSNCSIFFTDTPAGGEYVNPATPIDGTISMTNTGALTTYPGGSSLFVYGTDTLTLAPYNAAVVTVAPSVALTGSGLSVTSAAGNTATTAAAGTSSQHSQTSNGATSAKTTMTTAAGAGTMSTGVAAGTTSPKSSASCVTLVDTKMCAGIMAVLSMFFMSF